MRVVGYCRVSTEEQASSGAGTEAQRAAIRTECSRRGWFLARIEEDALSGRSMKRPGLHAALEACRRGEVGGIVVAKVDRLSRSIVDFAAVKRAEGVQLGRRSGVAPAVVRRIRRQRASGRTLAWTGATSRATELSKPSELSGPGLA